MSQVAPVYGIWYQKEGNQKYVEDNQISNFGCPPTTNFRFEFCYPAWLGTGWRLMSWWEGCKAKVGRSTVCEESPSKNLPASCLTIDSCEVSSKTAVKVGIACLSCICPRQYAHSCFRREEGSSKHLEIDSTATCPPTFFSENRARNLSFKGWTLSNSTVAMASRFSALSVSPMILNG